MKLDRRSFIKLIPILALATVSGSWWFLSRTAGGPTGTSEAPVTASTTTQSGTATTTGFDFPVTWNGDQPTRIDPNDYRLRIDGDVPKPLELTLEQLYAMSSFQENMRITCVEGWSAEVPWEGVPLFILLGQAGASANNIASVTIEGVTGYKTTLTSIEAADAHTIIALKAGGQPLTIEHGYPARLVAPSKLGLDWVKYVARITCTSK